MVDFRLVVKCRVFLLFWLGKMNRYNRWSNRSLNNWAMESMKAMGISIMNQIALHGQSIKVNGSLRLCVKWD